MKPSPAPDLKDGEVITVYDHIPQWYYDEIDRREERRLKARAYYAAHPDRHVRVLEYQRQYRARKRAEAKAAAEAAAKAAEV